jgi:aryl-alcohol dehydrogenase-like predicted oxidoreductase
MKGPRSLIAEGENTMQQRNIGDVKVSAIGLGAMQMSVHGRPDRDRSIATIHAALDAGITLIDTADAYSLGGPQEDGHNEILIAEALTSYGQDTSHVLVATKGGHTRPDSSWQLDGRPQHLKAAAEASLRRLGVDAIGLYQFHRPDPKVPFEDSVGALRDLLDEGKIRMAGVSNTNNDQIRQAQNILGDRLASVQNEFSPRFQSSKDELDLCTAMGIAFLPWSPLNGARQVRSLGTEHSAFAEVGEAQGVSPQRVTLAWMLSLSPVIIPIPGASRPETIVDSAKAADLALSDEELTRLNAAV